MFYIGQILPYEKPRGITHGPEIKPVWYGLTVPPQKEKAARMMLEANGVHAEYPTREVRHFRRGKAVVRKLPVVSRVVYAQFRQPPQWDVLKERKLITGVYGGSRPYAVPYDVVRAVMGLPTVAEELEAARREMLKVREGDEARICDGPLADFIVNVTSVKHGRVWFETMTGIKGDAPESSLERRVD